MFCIVAYYKYVIFVYIYVVHVTSLKADPDNIAIRDVMEIFQKISKQSPTSALQRNYKRLRQFRHLNFKFS